MGNELHFMYEEISVCHLDKPLIQKRLEQQRYLVQTYMNITAIFLDLNMPKPCFILSNWSLDAMLKAVYMKERGNVFPPRIFSLEDTLLLTYDDQHGESLKAASLIEAMRMLANCPTISMRSICPAHLETLIRHVDQLLCRLSPKVSDFTEEVYQSIFH
ncbi:hypothetical protein [Paenibacillus sp. J22TS3]|uniref:hypothetical protein n=1 Tax=Paenibacillus sp. J22TS3 TaxID=2807192 RepID=UPI001B183BFB|nr:hypothetical protein [Paenibacillus sp. J22TS3]GIP22901.1 hypothetical protein J22TS3_31760 [Paenibacillus sp. J22TS3]